MANNPGVHLYNTTHIKGILIFSLLPFCRHGDMLHKKLNLHIFTYWKASLRCSHHRNIRPRIRNWSCDCCSSCWICPRSVCIKGHGMRIIYPSLINLPSSIIDVASLFYLNQEHAFKLYHFYGLHTNHKILLGNVVLILPMPHF